ncbi:MAG: nitroreductase family protein [Frankia sp.]
MDALECLFTRRTAARLVAPEPTPDQFATILRAATTAPDHKWIRPWRFVVVRGEHRHQLAAAIRRAGEANSALPAALIEKQAGKATRSPSMIVIVASRVVGSKISRAEQDASAAAAAQNICLAAHALGLGTGWKTVPFSDSDEVRAALGLTGSEDLLGWVELGAVPVEHAPKPRPPVELSDVVTELVGGSLVSFRESAPVDQAEPEPRSA